MQAEYFDKNSIADASNLTLNKAKTKFMGKGMITAAVSAYPVDMNEDGGEEVFVVQFWRLHVRKCGQLFRPLHETIRR